MRSANRRIKFNKKNADISMIYREVGLNVCLLSNGEPSYFIFNERLPLLIMILEGEAEPCYNLVNFFPYISALDLGLQTNRVEKTIMSPNQSLSLLIKLIDATSINQLSRSLQETISNTYLKLRHDLLVFAIAHKLSIDPFEKPFNLLFPNVKGLSSKTPDLCLQINKSIFFIEVSITTTINQAEEQKREKYMKDVDLLNEAGLNTTLITIVLHPDGRNMPMLVDNLQSLLPMLNHEFFESVLERVRILNNSYSRITYKDARIVGDSVLDSSFIRDYTDLEKQMYRRLENAIQRDKSSEAYMNSFFSGSTVREEPIDFPNMCKYVPHTTKVSEVIAVQREKAIEMEKNYISLENPKPSLHMPLDPRFFKSQKQEAGKRAKDFEESLMLRTLHGINVISSKSITQLIPELPYFINELTNVIDDPFYNQLYYTGHPPGMEDFHEFQSYAYQYNKGVSRLNLEDHSVEEKLTLAKSLISKNPLVERIFTKYGVNNPMVSKNNKKSAGRTNIQLIKKQPDHYYQLFHYGKGFYGITTKKMLNWRKSLKSDKGVMESLLKSGGWRKKYFDKKTNPNSKQKKASSKIKTLIPNENDYREVLSYLEDMTLESENWLSSPTYILDSDLFADDPNVKKLKSDMIKEYKEPFLLCLQTKAARLAWNYHIICRELIMVGSRNSNDSEIALLCGGLSNIVCVAVCQRKKRNKDPGVAFYFIGILPEGEELPKVYGDVQYVKTSRNTIFKTSWRRLKLEKLTFMSDVFFNTLSSGTKNLLSQLSRDEVRLSRNYVNSSIQEYFTTRVIIGLNATQKLAEYLTDFKYIMMGSLSLNSKTAELLKDKLTLPINSILLSFFYTQFFKIAIRVTHELHMRESYLVENDPFDAEEEAEHYLFEMEDSPKIDDKFRGKIKMPFLWGAGGHCFTFNDFLDTVHIYAHTIKEPSSTYHENIKCLKTILKFDDMYKKMGEDEKVGLHLNLESLLKNHEMGFSASFISKATDHFLETYRSLDMESIIEQPFFQKPIAHFGSTKASIFTSDVNHTVKDNQNSQMKERCKVNDALIINNRKIGFDQQVDLQNSLIKHATLYTNQEKTALVDMCIKVQYGPKREFYILDIATKYAIKCLEEFFKRVCMKIRTECITIPGDLKLNRIQEMMETTMRASELNRKKAYYINGDCSKWSASEMLEVFQIILIKLRPRLGSRLTRLFFLIFESWKKKKLRIPHELFKSVFNSSEGFPDNENLNLLRKIKDDGNDYITLNQNFLMGIFNYFSSFKASIVYEYIKYQIESITLKSCLMFHLEHSDDYSIDLICHYHELKTLKTFITVGMRMANITDSSKKTFITDFLKEFVSLYNFQGYMCYPQIKKMKEVSSALSGLGYYEDMCTISSRAGELIRLGVKSSVTLLFSKLHSWLIRRLYSMEKGMENDVSGIIDIYNYPVELGGLPEVHPLLHYISTSNINSFRLMKFGTLEAKRAVSYLASNSKVQVDDLSLQLPHIKFSSAFYKEIDIKSIHKKFDINFKESQEFLIAHPSYKFLKPNQPKLLLNYLKSFYIQNGYLKAYSRSSRLQTTLRIAAFVKRPVVTFGGYERESLKSLMHKIIAEASEFLPKDIAIQRLTGGDVTMELFYETVKTLDTEASHFKKMPVVKSSLSPYFYNLHMFDTPIQYLIQYIFNHEDYILDNHSLNPNLNVKKEAEFLKKQLDSLVGMTDNEKILYTYNVYKGSNKKLKGQLSFTSNRQNIKEYIADHLAKGSLLKKLYNKPFLRTAVLKNPFNMEFEDLIWMNEYMSTPKASFLTLITLYAILTVTVKKSHSDVKNFFNYTFVKFFNANAGDLLRNLTLETLTTNELGIHDMKCLAYMQIDLYENDNIFKALNVQNEIVYYNFVKAGKKIGKSYTRSILDFKLRGHRAIMAGENGFFLLYTEDVSKGIALELFKVGAGLMGDRKLQKLEDETLFINEIQVRKTQINELSDEISKVVKTFQRSFKTFVQKSGPDYRFFESQHMAFINDNALILPIIQVDKISIKDPVYPQYEIIDGDYVVDRQALEIKSMNQRWTLLRFSSPNLFSSTNLIELPNLPKKNLIELLLGDSFYLEVLTKSSKTPIDKLTLVNNLLSSSENVMTFDNLFLTIAKEMNEGKVFKIILDEIANVEFPVLKKNDIESTHMNYTSKTQKSKEIENIRKLIIKQIEAPNNKNKKNNNYAFRVSEDVISYEARKDKKLEDDFHEMIERLKAEDERVLKERRSREVDDESDDKLMEAITSLEEAGSEDKPTIIAIKDFDVQQHLLKMLTGVTKDITLTCSEGGEYNRILSDFYEPKNKRVVTAIYEDKDELEKKVALQSAKYDEKLRLFDAVKLEEKQLITSLKDEYRLEVELDVKVEILEILLEKFFLEFKSNLHDSKTCNCFEVTKPILILTDVDEFRTALRSLYGSTNLQIFCAIYQHLLSDPLILRDSFLVKIFLGLSRSPINLLKFPLEGESIEPEEFSDYVKGLPINNNGICFHSVLEAASGMIQEFDIDLVERARLDFESSKIKVDECFIKVSEINAKIKVNKEEIRNLVKQLDELKVEIESLKKSIGGSKDYNPSDKDLFKKKVIINTATGAIDDHEGAKETKEVLNMVIGMLTEGLDEGVQKNVIKMNVEGKQDILGERPYFLKDFDLKNEVPKLIIKRIWPTNVFTKFEMLGLTTIYLLNKRNVIQGDIGMLLKIALESNMLIRRDFEVSEFEEFSVERLTENPIKFELREIVERTISEEIKKVLREKGVMCRRGASVETFKFSIKASESFLKANIFKFFCMVLEERKVKELFKMHKDIINVSKLKLKDLFKQQIEDQKNETKIDDI